MKLLKAISVAFGAGLLAVSLSGCSLFYPHWGATTFPSDSPSASNTQSSSASPTPSQTTSPLPSVTPVQTANVQIMSSNVDSTGGVIDVVAQVTNAVEDGGTCQLTVVSGSTSKTVMVKAERNVTTTQCYPMELSLTGLMSGTAVVTVSYHSAAFQGISAGQAAVIP